MSANEKPSGRAARAIWACATIDWESDSGEVARPILAEIVAMETDCDSLAEENQRLRGALERIANWPEVWIESGVQMRDLAVEALKK